MSEGEILEGRFCLKRPVGRGGTSVVWLAEDELRGEEVIIKCTRDPDAGSRESSVLQRLREVMGERDGGLCSVPEVYGYFTMCKEGAEYGFLAMEFTEGETLEEAVRKNGPFREEEAAGIIIGLCDVLGCMHSLSPPLIHRDLKPSNVVLRPDGGITLLDFGTARAVRTGASGDTQNLGTPGFAAPEQFGGRRQSDPRTDVYGACALLHFMLTGIHPSVSGLRPLGEFIAGLKGSSLEQLVSRCLSVSPALRCPDCTVLRNKLEKIVLKGLPGASVRRVWRAAGIFAGTACAAAILFLALKAGHIVYRGLRYERLTGAVRPAGAESAGDSGSRLSLIADAVREDPSREEAYFLILQCIAADGRITEEEKKAMDDILYASSGNGKNTLTCIDCLKKKKSEAYERFLLLEGLELFACKEGGSAEAGRCFREAAAGGALTQKERAFAADMLFLTAAAGGEQNRSVETESVLRESVLREWECWYSLAEEAEKLMARDDLLCVCAAIWREITVRIVFSAGDYVGAGADPVQLREVTERAERSIIYAGLKRDPIPGGILAQSKKAVSDAREALSGEALWR